MPERTPQRNEAMYEVPGWRLEELTKDAARLEARTTALRLAQKILANMCACEEACVHCTAYGRSALATIEAALGEGS